MITNKHFTDWESEVFGFGYGTGEDYTIPALRKFFEVVGPDGYWYEDLERELTPTVAWLLINILCRGGNTNIIEYGTSPRGGWLTENGKLIQEFLRGKSDEDIFKAIEIPDDYIHCYFDHCNCDNTCKNPLFGRA